MVQRDIKISKESVKKRRCWEIESSANEEDEENDVTRARGRNPVLARGLLIGKALILDQAVAYQFPQVILHGA
jgi:hypothetical protein